MASGKSAQTVSKEPPKSLYHVRDKGLYQAPYWSYNNFWCWISINIVDFSTFIISILFVIIKQYMYFDPYYLQLSVCLPFLSYWDKTKNDRLFFFLIITADLLNSQIVLHFYTFNILNMEKQERKYAVIDESFERAALGTNFWIHNITFSYSWKWVASVAIFCVGCFVHLLYSIPYSVFQPCTCIVVANDKAMLFSSLQFITGYLHW